MKSRELTAPIAGKEIEEKEVFIFIWNARGHFKI